MCDKLYRSIKNFTKMNAKCPVIIFVSKSFKEEIKLLGWARRESPINFSGPLLAFFFLINIKKFNEIKNNLKLNYTASNITIRP